MKNRITTFLPSLTLSYLLFPFFSSYLLLTFLTLLVTNVATAQIPSTGLVGYWPFNGNANDESGNGNNGTVNGATLTTDRFGNANSAYSFNGVSNYINVPYSSSLGIQQSFSSSVWIYMDGGSCNPRVYEIHENLNCGGYTLAFNGGGNGSRTFHTANFGNCSTGTYLTNGNNAVSTNSWHHVAMVVDGATGLGKLYVDGNMVYQSAGSFVPVINYYGASLCIGNIAPNRCDWWGGKLDELALYNRALTPAEVTQIYTSQSSTVATPSTTPCPTLASNLQTGLVGYWPFCGNANDESGNGNNGTVNGATLTADRFGNANSAYIFDRGTTSEINYAPSSSLNSLSNITISMWVKLFSYGELNQSGYNHLINKSDQNNNHHFVFANNSSQLYFYFDDGSNAFVTNNLPPLNQWSNLTLVYNYDGSIQNSYCKFYIDGALIESFQTTQPLGANSENLKIGSFGPDYYNRTDGIIDDISIYNRALTPTEITQLYTNPSVTPPVACTPFLGEDQTVCAGTSVALSASGSSLACPTLPTNLQTGLVGYWPFCGNANDASGNGNNGTVNGATLTTDRFGNANSAYNFDGTSGIQNISTNFLGVLGNNSRTIGLWFRESVFETNSPHLNNLVRYGLQSQGGSFELATLNNRVGALSNNTAIFYEPSAYGDWHFVTLVYESSYGNNISAVKVYLDGVILITEHNTYNLGAIFSTLQGEGLSIGGVSQITQFNGKIDDVVFFNRALSASEIQQLFTLGQSTYLWSTGATTASISVTPTQTTTYTCTVTDANGNACTDSVTVFVPQIEATDLILCAGESTTLSVSGINSTATPTACAALPSNLQNGLVGYWPFCGNANDASGNGNNGTVNGATLTTDRFGNANSAYSFNANLNSHILVPFSQSINSIQNGLTMSAWIYMNGGAGNGRVMELQGYLGGAGNAGFVMLPHANTNDSRPFELRWYKESTDISIWPSNPVPALAWHNITYTADGATGVGKFYLDGVLQNTNSGMSGQGPILGNCLYNNNSFFIGTDPTLVGKFGGFIDDVTLHNRALSASEVQQLFTQNPSSFLWSTGATTATINVSPTVTTTYTCTVTTDGVSCTDSVTVVVNSPTLDLGSDVNACGTATTLIAPTGYDSYVWSNGGTTNTTTVTANGTYTCTVTQGGCSASDAVDVTLVNPTITASDSTICAGQTITLSVPQGGTSNTACAALPTNLQNGLVGYWPFCGNANDASGNGNNGTVNGATLTTDRFGNANSAYYFNGLNTSIQTNDSPSISLNGDLTMSAWKFEEASNQSYHTLISKRLNGNWSYNLVISKILGGSNLEQNKIFTGRRNNGGLQTEYRFSDAQVAEGVWQHVAVTISNNQIKFYINGVDAGNILGYNGYSGYVPNGSVFTIPMINQAVGLTFGDNGDGGSERLKGNLDDVSIFNRALSPAEILQLYTLNSTTYLWSTGATTPTINVSPTSTTTYTCTVTTNGVSCTNSATVVVNNTTLNLGSDVTACGTSTTLTAPTGYDSYLWSNGGTTNTTTVTANGTYTCTVTQGGCSASDAVDVTLNNPTITASDSTICAGQTITLSVPQGGSSNTTCAALPTNLQNGLVGYWPFCGNANDASGNGNNGTVNGATLTADRFGNANSAYYFNGNSSYIKTPANGFPTNNRTITFWLSPENSTARIVCGYGGSGICGNSYLMNLNMYDCNGPGNITMQSHCCGNVASVPYSNMLPNQWNMLTYVQSDTGIYYFINGTQVSYQPSNFQTFVGLNSEFGIGTGVNFSGYAPYFDGNANAFFGLMDDISVYNRALSASEIQQLYNINSNTYLWSTGATTATTNVSPTTTTTYTCTVTTNGVSCTDSVTVVVGNPLASITPNGIVEICQGQSISLTGNGGVSFLWNTGAPTQSITVNTEATYTVTVTDANGCTDTESQLVKVNQLPIIGVNNASICPGQSATLTANGGVSYVWSPATGLSATTGSTVTASPATSTLYTITGTGANGCTNTATAAVSVNALPTATITPATATTFCQGGSVLLNANTGTGLSYQWKLNGTNITGATSSSYTANASGSYTVVVTNASSCSSTSTVTVVTVNALPTATITPATATTFCQGGSVVLNANTGTGLSYQWRLNGTNITGATSSSYTANVSGSYTVTVTNASTCSSTSTAVVVTVNALPTATITAATATTFCQGGSVVLNANTGTGLTYQWFNNAVAINGATSASYTANASGSYTVVVTNASTCSSTSTATVVTVNALPTATITAATATTFCQGGSVVLNANTGTGLSYQWKLNGTNITGATSSSYTVNASGSYTVVVTNASTCSSTSTATVVTVNALPAATITPATATTFCQGGSVVLNANTGTGLSYQWFNNAVAINGATSASYTANASGSYTVVVTNAATCSSTSTAVVVTVNALPTATITAATATTFCQGGSVVLNANTGTGLSYQWFNNATAISGATSSSYTANASSSYTVVVTNASTCSSTSTATVVTVNALPTATITPATATTFCQGVSVVLNANTGTGLTYQWRLNGTNITGATSSSYSANASGSYTVVVTNASACSSTSTATVVTVNALPTATITPATATTFCQGGSVVLNANTGTGLTYQWKLNGTNITGATSSSYTANASGSYTVTVTNASTCSSTSTATVVTVNALPTATITAATATTFCQGGSVVLNANTGTGLTYQWKLNGTNITGATSSSYTANTSGSYTVVVTNASTCSSTSTATVVTVNALPTATITPATATTFCQGGSVVLNANTGTGLSYQWFNNASAISGAISSSYTANASGSYTLTVTNASACSSTSTAVVVTVNALPTATITPVTATTFCQGGSVVLNANTGAGLSYQWFNNAIAIGGETTSSYSATASGTYFVVVTNNLNCSTTSSSINVTAIANVDYYADADGDGFGDLTTLISTCVQPQGYVTDNTDCKDNDASIYPGAQEICNDVDDDCNDLIDDGLVFMTYYADADGDSFGDVNNTLDACLLPDGYVTNNTDCNDSNANQNAASTEICNGEDDDCDGAIDNGLVFLDYYADLDSDGFGAGAATNSCVDLGAGYVTNNSDCNNANASINPNATEICNSIDDNCDGQIDEGITFTTYYQDFDNDGFGTGDAVTTCNNPGAGWVTNNTDCDDTNGNTNPNATEICNTIDDNCDGQIDEGLLTVYFIDNDGDTYGNPSVSILACTQPVGYTPDDTDCNDTDASINPGAEDLGGNGIDENCDGLIDNSIFELNASINLYPNPTRSELNIQISNALVGNDMYIFDAVGQLVYKQQLLSTQTTLSMSEYADGNYIFRVGELVKRFEVMK